MLPHTPQVQLAVTTFFVFWNSLYNQAGLKLTEILLPQPPENAGITGVCRQAQVPAVRFEVPLTSKFKCFVKRKPPANIYCRVIR